MLSPSKLNLGQEKPLHDTLRQETPCHNNSVSNGQHAAVPVSINNHKRNRQSYSEKEQSNLSDYKAENIEPCTTLSETKTHLQNTSNEEMITEPKCNSVCHKIDTQIDRCSVAKKPRDDASEKDFAGATSSNIQVWSKTPANQSVENSPNASTARSLTSEGVNENKFGQEDYSDDDDDYDDLDDGAPPSDMEDYLDEDDGEDAMMEDDNKSTASTSTEFSTGSSVGSNTPSLVGENLESFCLGETEKNGPNEGTSAGKNKNWVQTSPLVRSSIKPLRRSLFSHVPPTITFVHHNEVSETPLPAEVRKHLRWKLSNITPAVVKRIVTNSGFRLMRRTCTEWGGIWGKHMKSPQFKDIHEGQKLNHLPGTFNIGRKDRLWKNYQRLRLQFGKEEFSFLPRTFLLPSETKLLRRVWEKRGCRAKWIVKPPALARGTGIKVVNKWSQIPKMRPLIVQKYVARPHLINNTKYDLRIYVLLTSLCPLRVFLYDEGLVRFASNAYSADNASLSDVYTHLTNYSINKFSSTYQANEDSDCRQGHKWTLASLWQYFAESGIDSAPVIESIKDLVIKTIISAESSMYTVYRQNLASHYCGYELFGFDVLLDSKLKPWLIEVNISPSLHSSSPLDLDVKSPLATEVFNLARYHIPPAKMSAKTQREVLSKLNMGEGVTQLCMDRRLYQRELSKLERAKQDRFVSALKAAANASATSTSTTSENSETRQEQNSNKNDSNQPNSTSPNKDFDRSTYLDTILEHLTPDDVRVLIRSEDELAQATHFSRIFPTQDTHKYFKYFENPRYYNLLFDAWEAKYGGDHRAAAIDRLEGLCVEKIHLKVPVPAGSTAAGNAVQKNAKNIRTKPGPVTHPQPPLFSTIDVSSLKAPTGNSFIGEGFCGHTPPHSAGSLLDCVSTMERALSGKEIKHVGDKMESDEIRHSAKTYVRSENDSNPNRSFTAAAKVKVSQVSVTVKPNCIKTGTPPLPNSSRTKYLPKLTNASRKSVSSPESMSIGGDETTSSEKGSRSPSPFRSSNCANPSSSRSYDTKPAGMLLDNDPQSSNQMESLQDNTANRYCTSLDDTNGGCKNDNVNGNTVVDQTAIQ